MAPEQTKIDPKAYRDAIMELYHDKIQLLNASRKFSVPTRQLRAAIDDFLL